MLLIQVFFPILDAFGNHIFRSKTLTAPVARPTFCLICEIDAASCHTVGTFSSLPPYMMQG